MGELPEINNLVRNSRICTDAGILEIIAPPHEERDRSVLVQGMQALSLVPKETIPPLQPWRLLQSAGAMLTEKHVIRSNFFKVPTANIPETIVLYHIEIRRKMKGEGNQGFMPLVVQKKVSVIVSFVTNATIFNDSF
jgi:hypothetical protein